jgi:hypothetical protein
MVDIGISKEIEKVFQMAFILSDLRGLGGCDRTHPPTDTSPPSRQLACHWSQSDGAWADSMCDNEEDEWRLREAVATKRGQNPRYVFVSACF